MLSAREIVAVILPAVMYFVAIQARAADASDLSPEQLLSKVIVATSWTSSMHVRLDFRNHPVGWKKGDVGAGTSIADLSGSCEIYVSGDRLRSIRQNAGANGFDGAHVETLVTPGRRILWVKGDVVQYTDSRAVIDHSVSFDRGQPLLGWFLDGVLTDQVYRPFNFATALRIGQIQPNAPEEKVGGIACRVVDVVGDSWELHVWVAPSRGYNFARYKFDSKAGPTTRRAEFHCDIDRIEYQQLSNGTWVIQGGAFLNTAPDSHGGVHGEEIVVNRTFVDVSPDFDKLKAFDLPPIPNGEPAILEEAPQNGRETGHDSGVKYMWKDGKVVPAYDPLLIERIRKAEDPGSSK